MNEKVVSGLGWVALAGSIIYAAFAGIIIIEFINSDFGKMFNGETIVVAAKAMCFSILGMVFAILGILFTMSFQSTPSRKIILSSMIFWGVFLWLLFIGVGYLMFCLATTAIPVASIFITALLVVFAILIAMGMYHMEKDLYRDYKKCKH